MKPWVNASAQFSRKQRFFCRQGRKFSKGKTLGRAWATCKNGNLMGWWLRLYRNVSELPNNNPGLAVSAKPGDEAAYANRLRAMFYANGELR